MFAYDYENKFTIRIWGTTFKLAMYNEMKKLCVKICDRVMVTSLLTENGKIGGKVIGATGINTRTGKFYIFRGKANIITMSRPARIWLFSASGKSYPPYSAGNNHNTWYPASIIDSNGKEIPYIDRDGKLLNEFHDRTKPAENQKYFLKGGNIDFAKYEYDGPETVSSGKMIEEVFDILTVSEMIISSCLQRKSSSRALCFNRIDYPVMDPVQDKRFITIKKSEQDIKVGYLPLDYYGDLNKNYEKYKKDYLEEN